LGTRRPKPQQARELLAPVYGWPGFDKLPVTFVVSADFTLPVKIVRLDRFEMLSEGFVQIG